MAVTLIDRTPLFAALQAGQDKNRKGRDRGHDLATGSQGKQSGYMYGHDP